MCLKRVIVCALNVHRAELRITIGLLRNLTSTFSGCKSKSKGLSFGCNRAWLKVGQNGMFWLVLKESHSGELSAALSAFWLRVLLTFNLFCFLRVFQLFLFP